jgi:integrase
MPLRKHKNGRTQFEFDRLIDGRRYRATKLLPRAWTQRQCEQYDQKETAKLYAIAAGQQVDATIDQAVLVYLKYHAPTLKTFEALELEFKHNEKHYTGKKLTELNLVMQSINELEGLSPATRRNYMANIRSACRYAWKFHNMCDRDPAQNVKMPTVKNKREVYSTRLQMLELANAMPLKYRAYVRIGFYTGMRLGEILKAHVINDIIVLEDTKNGDSRIVPIHHRILSACRKYLPCKYAKTTIQKHWALAKQSLGIDNLHFHDLRHSAASEMINNDVDLYTVGAVLGHKDPASTKRYAHLMNSKLHDAVNAIGKKIRNV